MIDKQIEMQWQSSTTTSIKKNFIKLKVLMSTPQIKEEEEYEQELEKLKDLGIHNKPELPDSFKAVIADRYFNTSQFEVISWSHIWDTEYNCEMIIAELFFSQLRKIETINAIYTEKQWIEILNQIGYEC